MTLLGKVFTALILVMSVMFMSFAIVVYATHVNWKEMVKGPQGLETKLEDTKRKIDLLNDELTTAKNALAREQAARRAVLASLRTKLDAKDAELVAKVREYDQMLIANAKLGVTVENQSTTVKNLQDEVAVVRKSVLDAIDDRAVIFDQVVALTDQKNRLEGTRSILEERNAELLADVTKAAGHLEKFGIRIGDDLPVGAPDRDGFVQRVSKNLIEVTLGDDDGVRVGHELFVYREGTYLGRAVIRRTKADFAVAEIVQEFNRSVLIRKGDRVTTKLG